MGYGLGSSGSLCAASYDSFGIVSKDYKEIKDHLATMESFFHGTSSGLDPLTIYLNKPLHLHNQEIEVLKNPINTKNILVLDSGITRNAKSFIQGFNQKKSSDPSFQKALIELNELNTQAISNLLDGTPVYEPACLISQLQLHHFNEMIPDIIRPVWEYGLNSGEYAMKLSGAGGGGCFLLFTENDQSNLASISFPIIQI